MIEGHYPVQAELGLGLPPVALFLGPKSVGKTTLARDLAAEAGFLIYYERLSAGMAREIVETAVIRYARLCVRVIQVDGATEAAQNILLKVLEEPPPHCRFILVASRNPLPTIMSRSRIYRFGLLTDEQVAQVLRQAGASEHEAEMAAARGRGQVAPALEAVADREASRVTSVVAAAVRAAAAGGSGTSVDMALRNWTPEHTAVLRRWAMEKASGRWVWFTADFAPAATRGGALGVLHVLSTYEARTAPAVAMDALWERS